MTRLTRALPVAIATMVLLAACSSEAPQGATLPPLTTAVGTTTETTESATAPSVSKTTTEPEGATTDTESLTPSAPIESIPADSVPAEASALPLPTEQINIPADGSQEEADRAAIQAVWQQVWDFYQQGYGMTADEVTAEANRLLAGPLRDQFVSGFLSDSSRKLSAFGSITLHPYWYRPVGGEPYAMIGDCSDYSAFGVKDSVTGEIVNQGEVNANTVGQFIKTASGAWKLWQITDLAEQPCVP